MNRPILDIHLTGAETSFTEYLSAYLGLIMANPSWKEAPVRVIVSSATSRGIGTLVEHLGRLDPSYASLTSRPVSSPILQVQDKPPAEF